MPTETQEPNKSHKYLSIADDLRRRIRGGELKAGDRLPKFSEMRAMFGATPTTVERVYSLLESENLVVRENGRGIFVAGPQAPALKSTITMCGHVPVMDHAGAPFWTLLTEGIREALRPGGQTLSLCEEISEAVVEQSDGLLLMTYTSIGELTKYAPREFPMVSVVIPRKGIVSVTSQDRDGTHQAMKHLLEQGHRRIACLNDGSDGLQAMWRYEGYCESLSAAGIQHEESWALFGDPTKIIHNYFEWAREQMKNWLREGWAEAGFTALVTQNDEMAVGAMQVLQEAGYKVPEQISVIGFDSTIWCDFVSPPLTSIEMPLRKMGALATEILLQQIRGERHAGLCEDNNDETISLPTRLIVRQSTAPVA